MAAALCTLAAMNGRAEPLRVMSFNIRYATAPDGENSWDKRKGIVAETIRRLEPDLLGTQETLAMQADFLRGQFPDYTLFGVGRDDGKRGGEMTAILFRTKRFELLDSGHIWLSEHPDKPGSRSWDSACVRMVTWAKLRDRSNGGGTFLWLNTHWDHKGSKARLESAKLMRQWIAKHGPRTPLIITGDFNSHEDSPEYVALFGKSSLLDTYRQIYSKRQENEATFHGFSGKHPGPRIDYILISPDFKVVFAGIDHGNKDGHFPSDHFPVTAILVQNR